MKKKFIYAVAIVVLAAVAGWNYQQNQEQVAMSDLTLDNIEALASGEGDYNQKIWERYYRPDGTGYNCTKTGSETC